MISFHIHKNRPQHSQTYQYDMPLTRTMIVKYFQRKLWKKWNWNDLLCQIEIWHSNLWASQVALVVKNLPAIVGDIRAFSPWVEEIPWKRAWATHSSILAWRIPMDRGVWHATVHRVTKRWTWLKLLSMQAHVIILKISNVLYIFI